MISIDYGADSKLVAFDGEGFITPPNIPAATPADKFSELLRTFLRWGDVVTESPTVGSSGAEPKLIRKVVEDSDHTLYTLSARVVKNYVNTHRLPALEGPAADQRAAKILYQVATTNHDALKVWRFLDKGEKLDRRHKSVRPYDKRNYTGPEVDAYMARIPPFASLPDELQALFSNGKKRSPDYALARVLPFAMAFDEKGSSSRQGYEKVIGLYAHGYPSFYRRCTVALMQRIAKDLAGVPHINDVPEDQRKQAWRITRRQIRQLYHLSKESREM